MTQDRPGAGPHHGPRRDAPPGGGQRPRSVDGAAVLLVPVPPATPRRSCATAASTPSVFGAYVAAHDRASPCPINAAVLHRAVSWVREGDAPTDRESDASCSTCRWWRPSAPSCRGWWRRCCSAGSTRTCSGSRSASRWPASSPARCSTCCSRATSDRCTRWPCADADATGGPSRRVPRLMLAWLLGSGVPLIAIGHVQHDQPGAARLATAQWVALTSPRRRRGGDVAGRALGGSARSCASATGCAASSGATSTWTSRSTTSASSAGSPRA